MNRPTSDVLFSFIFDLEHFKFNEHYSYIILHFSFKGAFGAYPTAITLLDDTIYYKRYKVIKYYEKK